MLSVSELKTRVQGQADIVVVSSTSNLGCRGNTEPISEIKFVSQLPDSYFVQACTYAYLLESTRVILYDVRDGEKWEIIPHDGQEGLQRMIESVSES